jgi:hypothetical protein
MREQLGVVAGEHLLVHVEEELALAVVQPEEQRIEVAGEAEDTVGVALRVVPEHPHERCGKLRGCARGDDVRPAGVGLDSVEDGDELVRRTLGDPVGEPPRL